MTSRSIDHVVGCGGIRITETSIDEMTGTSVAASVPREQVVALEIGYGHAGERPILTTLLGLAIAAFGLSMLWHLVTSFLFGGVVYDIEGLGLALIPLGGWMLWAAWRRGRLLFIETRRERRRFAFARGTSDEDILAFHTRAQLVLQGIPFTLRLER
jgi:hypothetical protein